MKRHPKEEDAAGKTLKKRKMSRVMAAGRKRYKTILRSPRRAAPSMIYMDELRREAS